MAAPTTSAPGAVEVHCCVTELVPGSSVVRANSMGFESCLALLLRSCVAPQCLSFPECVMGGERGRRGNSTILKNGMRTGKTYGPGIDEVFSK